MTHEEFLKRVRLGLGKIPHPDVRDNLANLIRTKSLSIEIPHRCVGYNNPLIADCIREKDGLEVIHVTSRSVTIGVKENSVA